eukprot:NODE_1366_length_945_cov_230.166295_g1053_i0.p1 GENE.NODE_1366_length_945_cov_230.166295_g1053_i0~~NODE_1366_length_945_cov_230.166295_g1053_i0.p1  ORF type:complete len:190 (+),score=32.57 NODE_1366_length_945_cov_230.166295_g1053_i0:283-852(+)
MGHFLSVYFFFAMKLVALLLFVFLTSVFAYSRRQVPQYPSFGNPVHCLTEVSKRDSEVSTQLASCQNALCGCIGGQFSRESWQCGPPYKQRNCSRFQECYPIYLECVHESSPGCSHAALRQCEEHVDVVDNCDEGKACQIGKIPKGLSAGAIFAIAAGFIYLFAFLAIVGLVKGAKKKKQQPAYEEEED